MPRELKGVHMPCDETSTDHQARKPRTTEPVPSTRIPTSTKISRTSLPNLPPSSPSKPSNKKRTVIKDADEVIEEVEEEVEKQKPAAKVRAGPAKKKVKVDIDEEGDQVMISVEGKKTGIPAPKWVYRLH